MTASSLVGYHPGKASKSAKSQFPLPKQLTEKLYPSHRIGVKIKGDNACRCFIQDLGTGKGAHHWLAITVCSPLSVFEFRVCP
jgi:hypothetical protein